MGEILIPDGVRVSACPHPFRSERIDRRVPEGLSIAEILVAVQPDPVLMQHAHVFIDADYVPRERWSQVKPKAAAMVSVRVVPSGGDGKNPLAVILQIAVIAVAAWVGGLPAVQALGTFAQAAVVAGVGLVGSLLVNAIAPPPTPKFDRLSDQRDSPTYAINGGSNEIRPWGPVPLLLGRFRIFPPYAAQPYTEIDGDDQFWRVMFNCGIGPIVMEAHKLGETPIEDFPDVELEVRDGRPSDPPRELFTNDVFEEGLSIELTEAGSWQQRTTAQEADEISVDITFPSGLAFIGASGVREDRTVAIEVEYSLTGTNDWSVPSAGEAFAARDVGPMPAPKFKINDEGDTTRTKTFRIVIDRMSGELKLLAGSTPVFFLPGASPPVPSWAIPIALVKRRSDQPTISALDIVDERTVDAPFASAADFAPAPTNPVSDSIEIGAGTLEFSGIVTTARQTTTVRRGLRFQVPTRGLYDVRLRRTTPDSSSGQVVDLSFWTALRAIRDVDPVQLANVATVALRIRATGSLSGIIQQYNCIGTSEVLDWTGSAWVLQPTSNPASLYRWAFQGPHMKRPRTDAQMDLVGLQEWADANTTAGRSFNAYIDYRTTLRELTGDIASVGRASRAMPDGKWGVVRDRKQTVPAQMFTPRNSWGFTASKAFVDPPHGLNVRFINETIGYKRDERPVYADGFDALTATRLETLDQFGITDPDLIWKEGRYHQAVFKLRPEVYELNVDFEYLVASRGDLVLVAHDAMLVGLTQGRIKSVQVDGGGAATAVTLDELMTMEVGKTYALTVRPPDADPVTRAVNTVPGETDTVVFATTIPADTIDQNDLAAFGETDRVTAEMVIREIRPGRNASAKLILVDAAPAVHDADVLPIDFVPGDVDTVGDRIAIAGNPFFDGDILQFTTTDTLPPNLPLATDTFVVGRDDAGIQVSLTEGGAAIDLTGGGAGTHTATRQIPPFDSKVTDPPGVFSPAIESIGSDGAVLFRDVDGSLSSRIFLRLVRLSGGRFDLASIEGRYRIADTNAPFQVLPRVPAELREYSIRPVEDGETYEFQLRYVTADGREGEWSVSTLHLVEGKTAPPNDVTGFSAQQNGNAVTFQWNQVPDLDLDGYEVRFGPIGITWEDAEPLTEAQSGTRITDAAVPPGDWDFHIRAVDTTHKADGSRNYSSNSAVFTLTVSNALNIIQQREQKALGWPGRFTSVTTAKDSTSNGNDGTLTGGATLRASILGTSALRMTGSGSDGVEIPDHVDYSGLTDATMEFLVRITDVGTTTTFRRIITKQNGVADRMFMFFLQINTDLDLRWSWSDGVVNFDQIVGTLVLNQSYHLALVKTGNDFVVYLDGVPVASRTIPSATVGNSAIFQINQVHDAAFEFDDLRIWNVARTQTEIADNKDKELTGAEAGLVGYWKFNESTFAGFVYNPLTGNLNPNSRVLASTDTAQNIFNEYVWKPVAQAVYIAPEIDIDFVDRARTWGDIQSNLGPGETGLAAPELSIDYRTDVAAYDGFEPWTIGEAEARFFKHRLLLDTAKGLVRITGFQPTVDQLEERLVRTVAVSAMGSAIVFPKPFHIVPQVEISAEAGPAGAARYATWEAVTSIGFTARIFDDAGTAVAGNATYTATGV